MVNLDYQRIIERVYQMFQAYPDPSAREKGEGWSVKEILGHLVDSVGNNHQRLCRYIPQGRLSYPAYDQEQCVRRAGYQAFDFNTLLALWHGYNQLLLHMIAAIPDADLDSTISIGDKPPVPLRQLIPDYFTHMENHERQAQRIISG
ncbi:MAG: DinB family protein [Desulfobacteraceae bacterium]|nr:MAG: DinB family protein [Desulfobacteraceae bacterium]